MDLTWHADARLAVMLCKPGALFTGESGVFLVRALAEWAGPDPAPFALLVDAADIAGTTADYRAELARFFKAHRDVACIAMFHMSVPLQVATRMFSIGTGVPLGGFGEEAAAREWLRKRGIPA
jgi:hypothetical protein